MSSMAMLFCRKCGKPLDIGHKCPVLFPLTRDKLTTFSVVNCERLEVSLYYKWEYLW